MIELRSLRKVYGTKIAVKGLSLSVEKGQVLGLLGPNGAGKSTTMRMLSGCLRPTSGQAFLNEQDVWKNSVKAKQYLGFLPESAPSYEEQTVSEFLHFFACLSGLRGKAAVAAVRQALERCFLEDVQQQSIETLSKGYRHRACLAQSIIHDPPVIIFDEPTDGLDPNQKYELRRLIDSIRDEKAIILSTHILEEVDAVCTDVVVLNEGDVVMRGTPAELRKSSASARLIRLHLGFEVEGLKSILGSMSRVSDVFQSSALEYHIKAADSSEDTIRALLESIQEVSRERHWPVLEVVREPGSLAEVFRELTVGSNED